MLVELADADPARCGAKAATLGVLLRAGLPVPDGFVVPFDVHRAAGRASTPPTTAAPAAPVALRDALDHHLAPWGDVPLAVRSSADGEDGPHASAAGQHDTVLGVRGTDAVVEAVRTCWASVASDRAVAYRTATGHPTAPDGPAPAMAVLVQRLLTPVASGVAFTPADPGGATVVEAAWGLGVGVVGGTVTPDSYRVTADGAVTRTVADKRTRVDASDDGVTTSDVAAADRDRPALDDDLARAVAGLATRAAGLLGAPQDVEWALADGTVWLLQARPVTAALPDPAAPPDPATPLDPATAPGASVLVGAPGSRGTATGPARVVRGPGDFARVQPGDVLVCPWTDPAWTPLLRVAAGVVTETGGVLSHAAIVARERGIPAVLGVPDATTVLVDGTPLTVDGSAGTVTTCP